MNTRATVVNPDDRWRKLALRLTGLPNAASDALVMFQAGVLLARGGAVENETWRAGLCALFQLPLGASASELVSAFTSRMEDDVHPHHGSAPLPGAELIGHH
jgi:hypothetical protein